MFILSGPSGSGKTTIVSHLLASGDLPLRLSVSATTRRPRPGEQDGVAYHFWTVDRFEQAIAARAFLEWARVHENYYGTLRDEVEPFRARGIGVILDIDVQGAAQVRSLCPDAVSIFLRTSSQEAYEERLRKRQTEDEAMIRRRLANALCELDRAGEYEFQVVNDDLDSAVAQLRQIVRNQSERGGHAG